MGIVEKKHLEKVSKLELVTFLNNIRKCLIFTNSLFRSIFEIIPVAQQYGITQWLLLWTVLQIQVGERDNLSVFGI